MDPITQRILEQQRAIQNDPQFSNYQPSYASLDDGIAAIQAQPGFAFSSPTALPGPTNEEIMIENISLQPTGVNENLSFVQEGPGIDIKKTAGTIAKNVLQRKAMEKLGLEGIKGNILGSMIGGSALGFSNPVSAAFTLGSMLPDSVKGIAGLLRGKRAEKAIAKNILQDNQGADMPISPRITNMVVTDRDKAMGGGNIPTKSTPSTPKSSGATSNPYSGGSGGIHSGY